MRASRIEAVVESRTSPERVSLCWVCDWAAAGTDEVVAAAVEQHRVERHEWVKPGRLTRDVYLMEAGS